MLAPYQPLDRVVERGSNDVRESCDIKPNAEIEKPFNILGCRQLDSAISEWCEYRDRGVLDDFVPHTVVMRSLGSVMRNLYERSWPRWTRRREDRFPPSSRIGRVLQVGAQEEPHIVDRDRRDDGGSVRSFGRLKTPYDDSPTTGGLFNHSKHSALDRIVRRR